MTVASDDSMFPSLFAHALRKDWGVGIFAAETDGKRRYLFEDGAERTFAPGFDQMLHRVERPNDQQRAAQTRLRSVLAKRRSKDGTGTKAPGEDFAEQLARLRQLHAAGFSDPTWAAAVRGEGEIESDAELASASLHRQRTLDLAREELSASALDALISAKQFSKVWDRLVAVLKRTNLVPASQLKLKVAGAEPERALAVALRELLHGSGPYPQRFDRYLAAFIAAFNQHPKWELATAPSALLSPKEHVCVEITTFRKQIRMFGSLRGVASQPSSAAYAMFLGSTQLVAKKLGEQGESPRDLMDVRDFIVLTLKPPAKTPTASRQRAKASPEPEPASADAESDAEPDSDADPSE